MGDEGDRFQEVIDAFLSCRAWATRQAYAADLEDYASSQGQKPSEALRALLVERGKGQHLLLKYGVYLNLHGRAPATLRRRLATLVAATRLARERGLADFELEVPTQEEIEVATLIVNSNSHADVAYFLPRGDAEVDRLDLQHFALREALQGNYRASISRPKRILDVGCGTGQWAYELCEQFPAATVVGFDLVSSKRPWPLGYKLVRGNLLHGLPFGEASFDFVHQRFLVAGIPVKDWADNVHELVRVTRPGGWVEQVEALLVIGPAGPATARTFGLAVEMVRRAGLDSEGEMYRGMGDYLRRAGMILVEEREVALPIGEWGGRLGQMMATDLRTGLIRLADTFRTVFGIEEAEFMEQMAAAGREWEEHHTVVHVKVVVARKPG